MPSIHVVKGKYPHLGWVDIEGNGVATEIAVLKNGAGGLYFIRINKLDMIDKQRLFKIVTNRNSGLYELWDLMSNITLGNGANALDYFHQYVKVLTPSRQLLNPSLSRIVDPRWTGVQQRGQQQMPQQAAQQPQAPQPQYAPQPQPQPQPQQQPPAQQQVVTEAKEPEERKPLIKRTRRTTRKSTTKKSGE